MTVAVVVDGAASLPAVLAEEHRIIVVPMGLVIDGEIRPDAEVPTDELLERLQAGSVTTSAPAPGAFAAAIEQAVMKITAEKLESLAAGRMGHTTQEVGDLVVGYL